ncbi:hypothetical protein MHYP_G00263400 [Metynnis hypsauchen]
MADDEQPAPSLRPPAAAVSAETARARVPFRIELPAPFTGDSLEPFSSWIQRFEVALEVSTAHLEKAKLLAARLSGPAFAYWQSLPAQVKFDYDQAKAKLNAVFGQTQFLATFQTHLNARPRRPQEPLEVYAADLTNLVADAFPLYGSEAQNCEVFRRFVTGLDPSLQLKIHEHGAVTLEAALKVATQCERAQLALTVAAHTPVMPVTVTPQPGITSHPALAELTAAIADLRTDLHALKQTHLQHTEKRLDHLTQQVSDFQRALPGCAHTPYPSCNTAAHACASGCHRDRDNLQWRDCVDCCVTSSHPYHRGRRPHSDGSPPPRHRARSPSWTFHDDDQHVSSYDTNPASPRRPRQSPSNCHDAHYRQSTRDDCSPSRFRRDSHPVILGWDFLTQHNVTLSIPQAHIQLHDTTVPFAPMQHLIPVQCAAITASPVTVPPLSEMVITVSVNSSTTKLPCSTSYVGIVEPQPPSTSALAVARTLTTVRDGQGLVRVVNPTSDPVSLAGGCPLGQVFSVSGRSHDKYTLVSAVSTCSTPRGPAPTVDLSNTCLTPDEIPHLESLLRDFGDVFSSHPYDYGRTDLVHHCIDTGAEKPIKLRPYRASPATQVLLKTEVDKLLEHGIIEESHSPWSAPVVLVRKKDGTHRFCVDYRRLNSVTVKDSHPLPRVDDTLDRLAGAQIFSTIDLTAGYWQIPLHPRDKEKTAFSTGSGLFHFRMMPMGISNAPPSFQRLMELVLCGLHWDICLIYLDDIIVYSTDFSQHLQHLKEVFQRFRAAGLKLKPSKCHLARSSVTFLGHHISSAGIRPDPANIEKVSSWPVPHSATEVRAFLGLCSYYRRFIRQFSHIAEPLHRLTHKGVVFEWSSAANDAFQTLKQALTSPPVLAFPNLSAPFLLHTDASLHAIGSVLSQKVAGKEHAIAFASHTLSASERKWSTFDRELYAIVWSVRHFRHYLAFHPFTIVTDHKPLVGLKKLPLDHDHTGRRARWAVELDLHDWTIVHRDGAKHLNADAMSRRPSDSPLELSLVPPKPLQTSTATQTTTVCVQQPLAQGWDCHPKTKDSPYTSTNLVHIQTDWDLSTKQQSDPDIATVLEWLGRGHRPPIWKLRKASSFLHKLWSQFSRLTVCEGLLCRRTHHLSSHSVIQQVVIPHSLVPQVLHYVHGHPAAGHYGPAKSLDKASRSFYWPYMSSDIYQHCRQCAACQSRRSPVPRPQAPLVPISPSRPLEIVAADLTELPMSAKGNRYVLVLMDLYTKFVNLYPLKTQTAVSVAQCIFEQFIPQHGVPESLHSDQGRQFESDLIKHLCGLMAIRKLRTSPYHAQCDGAVERYNRTLKEELSKYLFELGLEWDDHLPQVALAYNTTVHASTGFTPFYLAHGRDARVPVDTLLSTSESSSSGTAVTPAAYAASLCARLKEAYKSATAFRNKAQERQRKYYDRRLKYSPYKPGDLVLVDDPAHRNNKLAPRWIGPFVILDAIAPEGQSLPVDFRVHDLARPSSRPKVLHYNRLKPFVSSSRSANVPAPRPRSDISSGPLLCPLWPDIPLAAQSPTLAAQLPTPTAVPNNQSQLSSQGTSTRQLTPGPSPHTSMTPVPPDTSQHKHSVHVPPTQPLATQSLHNTLPSCANPPANLTGSACRRRRVPARFKDYELY